MAATVRTTVCFLFFFVRIQEENRTEFICCSNITRAITQSTDVVLNKKDQLAAAKGPQVGL